MRSTWLGLAAALAAVLAVAPAVALADEPPPAVTRSETSAPPAAPTAAGQRKPNRLASQSSPYLLLHAHNPVDWYPWGDEALAKAKAEKKPIFLSIGYSSCYWCHVMERESFMDEEIARAMNDNFVCIKVDREERPDLDEVYMRALQIYLRLGGVNQGGGWPLSMFLTPDAKPIAGGSYFPPRDRENQLGFLSLVTRVREAWAKDPDTWQRSGDALAGFVAETLQNGPPPRAVKLDRPLVDGVLRALAAQYDPQHGGFGFDPARQDRPKFPEPPNLNFLLEQAAARNGAAAKTMLLTTLEKISLGGIRDHVGGGFHRYSTDRAWRVPHFEKMLYDNAQLAGIYAHAFELTDRDDFRAAAEETIEFMFRELADPAGGFYAAIDAETDAHEGRYYVWTREEAAKGLTQEEFELWGSVYGLAGEPNFEDRYIALLSQPLAAEAAARAVSPQTLAEQLRAINGKLLAQRQTRKHPLVDTKILAGWNGLAMRGLADAGRILKRPDYVLAAELTADFVLKNLRDDKGRLLRSYAARQARQPAFLDDYALVIDGLIALHEATGQPRWLAQAAELMELQLELFWDPGGGGFFFTSTEHEVLIARSKLPIDNVMPSGNSASALNLLYLAKALPRPEYRTQAEKCFRSAAGTLEEQPAAVPQLAVGLLRWLETAPAVQK